MCCYLVSIGYNPKAVTKENEITLYFAAQAGSTSIVSALILKGVDPKIPDSQGNTPLHIAVQKDFSDVAEILLNGGADPNARNMDGMTPIFFVKKDSEEMLQLLISKSASINVQDNSQKSLLRTFLDNGATKLINILMEHNVDLTLTCKG